MNTDHRLVTSDNVELSVEIAGLGSRIAALVIDLLIQGAMLAGLFAATAFAERRFHLWSVDASKAWIAASYLAGAFVVTWGYFLAFELLWGGATPGKRRMRLRVVANDGRPVSTADIVIRNALRVVDQYLFVGLPVAFISPKTKRLGDYLAGTLVVHVPEPRMLEALVPSGLAVRDLVPAAMEAAMRERAARLTNGDYQLVREYLARAYDLDVYVAKRIGVKLAAVMSAKLGIDVHRGDADPFLQALYLILEEEL